MVENKNYMERNTKRKQKRKGKYMCMKRNIEKNSERFKKNRSPMLIRKRKRNHIKRRESNLLSSLIEQPPLSKHQIYVLPNKVIP